jgi:hypothetical protein
MSFEEQKQAETMFSQIKCRHRKVGASPSQNTVFIAPPERKSEAIALVAFRDVDSEQLHRKMEHSVTQAFDTVHVNRCLVIAVNIDKNDRPYSALAVFDRGATTHREVKG